MQSFHSSAGPEPTSAHSRVLPAGSTKASHIAGIDTLRIVAAVWVVLSHAGGLPLAALLAHVGIPEPILRFVSSVNGAAFDGVAAVIVFFVISGLCIHLPVVNSNQLDPIRFWVRRGLRVGAPLIGAVILSGVLLGQSSTLGPVLWSLYCELIYYAIYPGLLKIASATGWHLVLAASVIASALTVLVVSNNGGFIWGYGLGLTWVYGLPVWILGVLLAERARTPSPALTRSRLMCLRLAVWLASSIATVLHFHSPVHYKFSMLLFSPLAFYWVLEEIRAAQERGTVKVLEVCGRASYSVYLCHIIVLAAFTLPPRIGMIRFLEVWLACAAFCAAFYLSIESPSHNLARMLARWAPSVPMLDVRRANLRADATSS